MSQLIYSGIGSRKTPQNMCLKMTHIASQLEESGWLLRSGHAEGADQAFEIGTRKSEIHLPWEGYENAAHGYPYRVIRPRPEIQDIARRYHPKWDELSNPVKLLMCRNVTIVLGEDLETHSKMVICWTEGGRLKGGTAHGMKIAYAYDIPVFNIALPEDQIRLCSFTTSFN